MPGQIYRPNIPHPHYSLVLTNFSTKLPYILQDTLARRISETDNTLDIAVEEDTPEGRMFIAKQMMLIPMLTHWHRLRFGDITQRERELLRGEMRSIREVTLHVR